MTRNKLILATAAFISIMLSACQMKEGANNASQAHSSPLVIGHGEQQFEIGELLYSTEFESIDDWTFQVEASESPNPSKISNGGGLLDIYMPARGCTAWLNQKFEGPITIVYDILCPEETITGSDIQARDINNFWHASDPVQSDGIFDADRYTGSFGTYNKMHAYYASTGGGGAEGNHTTRFRRYPRDVDGSPVEHIALNDRDENPDFLITPGKWHQVQLVAFNGLAQYIVDGKVVYEIKEGDRVSIEKGSDPAIVKTYTLNEFPPHTEGYVGLRMVRTHHKYRNFRVYQLETKK